MSHHPGCPKNQSLYADCTCAAIDLREHTEALNRNTQTHDDRLAQLEQENAGMRALLERIRTEPDLLRRGGAGGQDQYAGMPRVYPLIDTLLKRAWTG